MHTFFKSLQIWQAGATELSYFGFTNLMSLTSETPGIQSDSSFSHLLLLLRLLSANTTRSTTHKMRKMTTRTAITLTTDSPATTPALRGVDGLLGTVQSDREWRVWMCVCVRTCEFLCAGVLSVCDVCVSLCVYVFFCVVCVCVNYKKACVCLHVSIAVLYREVSILALHLRQW